MPEQDDKNPQNEVRQDQPEVDINTENQVVSDPKTDSAVVDIEREEGDQLLEENTTTPESPKSTNRKFSLRSIFRKKKFWIPALAVVVIIAVLAIIPYTRYKIAGLVIHKNYSIKLIDSQTKQPISSATIEVNGKTYDTNSTGRAHLQLKLGTAKLFITKKYYKSLQKTWLVGFTAKTNVTIALQATGRQVPIALVNMITNQPVANATIDAAGTNATTNSKGMVSIVLPANKLVVNGTISANGYNNELVGIHISSAPTVSQNTFQLTPSGRVYFLSNATGTIDVVSTNLDGTNKKIVLQGTGNESPQSTSLIPSADQQYLAFQAQRSSSSSVTTLYGISTNNGHLFTIDQGTNVSFQPEGWINHYFVYVETNNSVSNWQSGQQILKSYNADTGKLVTLDQTNGVGTDSNNYAQQQFTAVNLTNDSVIYAKTWDIYSVYATTLQGKQNSIYSIQPNATNKVDLHDIQVSAASLQYYYGYIQSIQTTPKTIYYQVPTNNYSSYSYLEYNNGTITQPQNYTQTNFNQQTSTYQGLSASGLRSLYTASRDGELAVIIGDQNGNNQKQIALLGGGYSLVGWYGNDYILLSKSSTLYVLSATGQGQPIRISPYLQTLGPGYA